MTTVQQDANRDRYGGDEESIAEIYEEYFSDYERVRGYGSIDMFNVAQIAQHAGMPEEVVRNIQRYYRTYAEMSNCDKLSPYSAVPQEQFGYVSASYKDLCDLYGIPMSLRPLKRIPLRSNIRWNTTTPYGNVTISYFSPSDSKTITDQELAKVTQWRIAADTRLASDVISQEVHRHAMERLYGRE